MNDGLPEPLNPNEVMRIAGSAWKIESNRQNWVGQPARAVLEAAMVKQLSMAPNGADALILLANLRIAHGARHGRGARFAISPTAMSNARTVLPWSPGRIRRARQALIELGFLVEEHHGGSSRGDSSLFRFVDRRSD
jgi:hypothetical protein